MAQSKEQGDSQKRVARVSRLSEARVTELLGGHVSCNTFDVSAKGILVGADNCILTQIDRNYFS